MPTPNPLAANPDALVIPGRECGTCTLCCKVYKIPEIGKEAGKWCKHCSPGKGCAIHDNLPHQCAVFNCRWRTEQAMLPHWKPEQCKMVVTVNPRNNYIYVRVDPGTPSAWRKQPYYDRLRQLARTNLELGAHIVVFVNDQATLIMPDQDVPLGPMKPTDGFSVRRVLGPNGPTYEVRRGEAPSTGPLR
jgi:hypothetical protein